MTRGLDELKARIAAAEVKRRTLSAEVGFMLVDVPQQRRRDLVATLDGIILAEGRDLEEAKKETERLMRGALHHAPAKVG